MKKLIENWLLRDSRQAHPALDEALEAWKSSETAQESLSGQARAGILAGARRPAVARAVAQPLAPLFLPIRRVALAAGLPAILLAAVFGLGGGAPSGDPAATRVRVAKRGAEVIFIIANGKPAHDVTKSNDARGLADAERFRTIDGTFRDGLQSDSGNVFYRID